ncbi:MAG: hypothetical protein ABIB97_05585 [Patescibacteria group bacterium]
MKLLAKLKFWKEAESIYEKIIKTSVYFSVFLLPVFLLPFSQDLIEISKTILLYFFVSVASGTYLLQMVVEKRYKTTKNKINILVLSFLLLYIISTIFSLNWRVSLFGLLGYYDATLITTIFLVAFYFVIINTNWRRQDILKIFYSLFASAGLVIIFSTLQLFDVHLFSQIATQSRSFNLVANSVSVFAVFLALIIPIALGFIMFLKKTPRILLSCLALASFVLLILFDSYVGWFALVVGLFLFLIFIAWQSRELASGWVILPTFLIIISILMIFLSVNNYTNLDLENDIVLGQGNSWKVTGSVLRSRFLSGSGPQTFHYDLVTHRPDSFNAHPYWNLSFVKANSQWSQFLATTGIINFLVILTIAYLFLSKGLKRIISQKPSLDWIIDMAIVITFFSLLLLGFVYSYNIVMSFIFWLMLALGTVRFLVVARDDSSVVKKEKKDVISGISFALGIGFVIVVMVFSVRFYMAEYHVVKAQESISNLDDIKTVEDHFIKASRLNPFMSDNYFGLAESYLVDAGLNVQQGINDIDNLIILAAAAVNKGVELENDSARALRKKAAIYRDFRQYVTETEKIVFANYDQIKLISPNDPLVYYEAGQSYLVYALDFMELPEQQKTINQYLDLAEADLLKAVEIKKDFIEARFILAQVYDLMGQAASDEQRTILKEKIISELETILLYDPGNQTVLDYLAQIKTETI